MNHSFSLNANTPEDFETFEAHVKDKIPTATIKREWIEKNRASYTFISNNVADFIYLGFAITTFFDKIKADKEAFERMKIFSKVIAFA